MLSLSMPVWVSNVVELAEIGLMVAMTGEPSVLVEFGMLGRDGGGSLPGPGPPSGSIRGFGVLMVKG